MGKILSESDAAHAFSAVLGHRIRFVPEKEEWIVKTGRHWSFDKKLKVEALVREFLDGEEQADARWKGSYNTVRNVRALAERDVSLHLPLSEIDSRKRLIGTEEGIFDLRKQKDIRPTKETYITLRTSVEPDFDARPSRWLRFLRQIFRNDGEQIAYLQRWCGYLLSGSVKEHALLILYGPGGNGKSVLVNTVATIMGTYHREAAPETFVESRTTKHETAMAYIAGARFVTSGETDEGANWSEATMKRAVSGDPVTARFLYKNPFTYRPTYKIWIATNHLPKLKSVGHSMRRRIQLLELDYVPKNPDPDLEDKIAREHEAILAWMLEGARDWLRYGLMTPRSVVNATDSYFEEQDSLGTWLNEKTRRSENALTPSRELCSSYNRFLYDRNLPPVDASVFGRQLSSRGFKPKLAKAHKGAERTRCFEGLRLKKNT